MLAHGWFEDENIWKFGFFKQFEGVATFALGDLFKKSLEIQNGLYLLRLIFDFDICLSIWKS